MPRRTSARPAALTRRAALGGLLALPLFAACGDPKAPGFAEAMTALEAQRGAQVGVFALDTGSGKTLEHRADQRFMMCSTFKALLVGAVLRKAQGEPGLLERELLIPADPSPTAGYAPFARSRLGKSVSIAQLCEASVQISDNIAANLLVDLVGGPGQVTAFFRSIGDETTRLDRYEETMSDGEPKGLLDTTTPRAIATSLRALTLDDALAAPQRTRLVDWMLAATTGTECIRAGLPRDWKVGDKTGTGSRGERNDIAVAWPPGGKAPLVLAILTRTQDKAARSDKLLADVTSAARSALAL